MQKNCRILRTCNLPLAAVVWSTVTAGCNSHDVASAADLPATIRGQVTDAQGAGLGQARVRIDGQQQAQVGQDGSFAWVVQEQKEEATSPAQQANDMSVGRTVLTLSAPGYATIYRTVRHQVGSFDFGQMPLRRQAAPVTLILPEAGADPVQLSTVRMDSRALLSVGPGQLVDRLGQPATGPAQVVFDFWHGYDDLRTGPSALIGQDADGSVSELTSYGMVGIEISQNGEPLQVAPSQSLRLQIDQTAPRAFPLEGFQRARLWWLDPQMGVWSAMKDPAVSAIAYDPVSKVATAALPHLSYWNFDGAKPAQNGGCLGGRVFNACKPTVPLPYTNVTVWFLSHEQTGYNVTRTNGNGRYCLTASMANALAQDNDYSRPVSFHYMVTGQSMSNTTSCNPLPKAAYDLQYPGRPAVNCQQCSGPTDNPFASPEAVGGAVCNNCRMSIPGYPAGWRATPDDFNRPTYTDTCLPPTPTANLKFCSFCDQDRADPQFKCELPVTPTYGQCAQLQDAFVRPSGCSCAFIGQSCASGQGCCPQPSGDMSYCEIASKRCRPCLVFKIQGDRCGVDSPCCTRRGESPLECSDNICQAPDEPWSAPL